MLRGLYAAATALDAASQAQEVTANNLAHSNTPGYRQRGVVRETFDRALGRTQQAVGDITGTRVSGVYHDFRQGGLQTTGNPLDMALNDGDTFFTMTSPDGQQIFSRNGSFFLGPQGQIVSQGGYRLQGDSGPIAIPPGTANINIANDGNITADGQPVGRVALTRFANPEKLVSVGPTLFTAPPDANRRPAADGLVTQGARETSNVNPADAMVQMIIGSRYYDAAQRALRAIAESVQLNTRPQG